MALEERLKQRLLGGAVLVALVVIFVPMLIDEPMDSKVVSDHRIPPKPKALEKPMPAILPPPPAVSEESAEVERQPKGKSTAKPAPVSSKPAAAADAKQIGGDKPSPTAWMIQVASLTVKDNAERLVADLKKSKLPAMVERVEVDGKRHYRVRVGPEVNHKTALSMAKRIKREFKLTPKVLRYPD